MRITCVKSAKKSQWTYGDPTKGVFMASEKQRCLAIAFLCRDFLDKSPFPLQTLQSFQVMTRSGYTLPPSLLRRKMSVKYIK